LRLFSFGGCGLALAALALVVFGAYDIYPSWRGDRYAAVSGLELTNNGFPASPLPREKPVLPTKFLSAGKRVPFLLLVVVLTNYF